MIAILGASGFIGSALLKKLPDGKAVGIARSAGPAGVVWRRADVLDLGEVREALRGCDQAVYLVHSMMTPPRGVQARFEDLDLLAADNFRRACEKEGVRRVVYVGGLMGPGFVDLSRHLSSRLEVEETIASGSYSTLTIRSGLVLGPGGSSCEIMLDLVRRLPIMLCPRWMSTPTTSIALEDLLTVILQALQGEERGVWEVGSGEPLTYRKMIETVAAELGKRRHLINVPFLSPRLSRLWVQLVTGKPRALVYPLVESLKTPMLPESGLLARVLQRQPLSFQESLASAIHAPSAPARASSGAAAAPTHTTSIQRLPWDRKMDAETLAKHYFQWSRRWLGWLIRIDMSPRGGADFRLLGMRRPLISIRKRRTRQDSRELAQYWVRGGLLVGPGRPLACFEFRVMPRVRQALVCLFEYRTALPSWLYRFTQAIAHVIIMRAFSRSLSTLPVENPTASH